MKLLTKLQIGLFDQLTFIDNDQRTGDRNCIIFDHFPDAFFAALISRDQRHVRRDMDNALPFNRRFDLKVKMERGRRRAKIVRNEA